MISSKFYEQFAQLAERQSQDQNIAKEVSRINSIIQRPMGSVQDAFQALRDVSTGLSKDPSCSSLARGVRLLVRQEKVRLMPLLDVAEAALSGEKEVSQKRRIQEAHAAEPQKKETKSSYPSSVLELYGEAWSLCTHDFKLSDKLSECNNILENAYKEAEANVDKLLEEHFTSELAKGIPEDVARVAMEKEKAQILELMQQEKASDIQLIQMFAQEQRKCPFINMVVALAGPNINWQIIRQVLEMALSFARCLEGRESLIRKEPNALESPDNLQIQKKFFQNYGEQIRALHTLMARSVSPQTESLVWLLIFGVSLFAASCPASLDVGRLFSLINVSDVMRELESGAPEAAQGFRALVDHMKTVESAISEPLISGLSAELREFLSHTVSRDLGLNFNAWLGTDPMRKFFSVQNELQVLVNEGFSVEALEVEFRDIFSNPFYPVFKKEFSKKVRDIQEVKERLKAEGADAKTIGQILSNVAGSPSPAFEGVLKASRERIQKLIQFKDNLTIFHILLQGVSLYVLDKCLDQGVEQFPSPFFHPAIEPLLCTLSEDELKVFIGTFKDVINRISIDDIVNVLISKERRNFVLRVLNRSSFSSSSQHPKAVLERACRIFDVIHGGPSKIDETDVYAFASKLTPEEKLILLKKFPPKAIETHYFAERLGLFEPAIEKLQLDSVTTEPLIRLLFSKGFEGAKAWLEEPISRGESRLQTLSSEQKKRILSSFPCYESKRPLDPWRQLLGFTEGQATILAQEVGREVALSHPVPELKDIDPNDPISVFAKVPQHTLAEIVLHLLLAAKESSICGERSFLTWGNASATSSPCVASDSCPLRVRVNGNPMSIYPRGAVVNDFSFPVQALALRKRIVECTNNDPHWVDSMNEALRSGDPDLSQDKNIYYEIVRISDHIKATLPSLVLEEGEEEGMEEVEEAYPGPDPMEEVEEESHEAASAEHPLMDVEMVAAAPQVEPRPSGLAEPMEVKPSSVLQFTEQNMRDVEKQFMQYRESSEESRWRFMLKEFAVAVFKTTAFEKVLNLDNMAHSHALFFMLLFLLARHAKTSSKPDVLDIQLSSKVSFHLKYIAGQVQVLLQDNPGFTQRELSLLQTEYPLHTLSPITLNYHLSPQNFASFVESIQKLSDQDFYSLCAACVSKELLSISEDDSLMTDPREYLDKVKQAAPSTVGEQVLTDITHFTLLELAKEYVSAMPHKPTPLLAKNQSIPIPLDRFGLDDYVSRQTIPSFIHSDIRSEGNYASAICNFMIPYEPLLGGGNCGVNSFLMGLLGRDECSKLSEGSLYEMVREFRTAVVQYARDNEAKLKETYGENEVKKLIEYYGEMESHEWTGTIVWECAAHICKRPIVVYGSPAAQGVPFFSGDKDGEIRPSAIFSPDEEPVGPPINLMQWDVHYCFLERK